MYVGFLEQYYKAQYKPQYTNHNIAQSIISSNRNWKSWQNNHSYVIELIVLYAIQMSQSYLQMLFRRSNSEEKRKSV